MDENQGRFPAGTLVGKSAEGFVFFTQQNTEFLAHISIFYVHSCGNDPI